MKAKPLTVALLIMFATVFVTDCVSVDGQQPEPTMFLYGYVFIRTVTGESITAPEGLHVYAKVNQTIVANTTILKEGRYTLPITSPQNGTLAYIFVQSTQVTSVQYYDWNVTWLNLTVIDSTPPVIEPSSPTPSITLRQQLPLWINATVTDDLAVNGSSITTELNETSFDCSYNFTSELLTCRVEQAESGFYTINVTAADLSGNTASRQWNFTFFLPEPPKVETLSPTTENPFCTRSGKSVQITYNYADPYPKNATLAVYNATQTIGQLFIATLEDTIAQRNDTIPLSASASDGEYAVSVTVFNLFNLGQKAEQTAAIIVDNTPPTIGQITQTPPADSVQPTDTVMVNATVKDALSEVLNATLFWRPQDGGWNMVVMNRIADDVFSGRIPPLQTYATGYYKIEAFDKAGNQAVADNAGQFYTYNVIPEYPTATLLICVFVPTLTAMSMLKCRKRRKQ